MNDQLGSTSITRSIARSLAIVFLRVALVVALFGFGWLIYKQLPATDSAATIDNSPIKVEIVLRNVPEVGLVALDIPVNIYPIDIVAVRTEFFTEPRKGKRFEDFLSERMKGRTPVNIKLDKNGQGAVVLSRGSWWLHAKLTGDEEVEWRLPLTVAGDKQTVELTPHNAYTRSKTF